MKKVLIFGGYGFAGKYLIKEFENNGYEVYATDKVVNHTDIHSIECNILDKSKVDQIVDKVQPDYIVNLAAISSVGRSWSIPGETIEINICGTVNILEAVRKNNANIRVLLIGSSEEYETCNSPIDENVRLNANNPYGISKLTQEMVASLYREHFNMEIYYVRAFNHTGVGQKDNFVIPSWCKQIAAISKSGKPGVVRVGNLTVRRDFSNVKDIVRAYRMVIESDDCYTVYNIGSGKSVQLSEILKYIISLCKQEVKVETEQAMIRPIENPIICCNHSLITEKLGWKPEYSIFDTAKEIYDYYENTDVSKLEN